MKQLWAVIVILSLSLFAACGGGAKERPLPPGTPFPDDLAARVRAVRDKMAKLRELPVNTKAREDQVSRQALADYYQASASDLSASERSDVEAFDTAYRLMHMIGPDDSLLPALTDYLGNNVLGFYVTKERRLVLVSDKTSLTQYDEYTLAHEYVHSLQDGSFDIAKLDKRGDGEDRGKAQTEYSSTASCIQEGDAVLASTLYARDNFGAGWEQAIDGGSTPESSAPTQDKPVPPAIERYLSFDYNECVSFIADIWRNGGWSAVDAVLKDPPSTTEQILNPQKYRVREPAKPITRLKLKDRLGGGWQERDASPFGEFDVYNYLATLLNDEATAKQAAAGWGGGWISIYTRDRKDGAPQDVLVDVQLEWDTAADFGEFMTAYGQLLDKTESVDASRAGIDGPACWDTSTEYGYLGWDAVSRRIDLVISNSAEARDAVTNGLLSSGTVRPCKT